MNIKIIGALLVTTCMLLRSTDVIFRQHLLIYFTPIFLITIEHMVGATLLSYKFKHLKKLSNINYNNFLPLVFVVFGTSVGGIYFFTKAFNYMNPAVVILLQKLQPIFAIILSFILLKERPTKLFWPLAIVSIIAGYILTFKLTPPQHIFNSMEFEGCAYAIISVFFWGGGTVFGKKLLKDFTHQDLTVFRYYGGFLFSLLILLVFYRSQIITNISLTQSLSIVYVAIVPGLFAIYLFYKGLKSITASQASFLELIFPLASAIIVWIVLKRPLELIQVISGIVLLLSVTFIGLKKTVK